MIIQKGKPSVNFQSLYLLVYNASSCTHTRARTHRCILTYEVAVANHPDGPFKAVNSKHLLFPLFVYWEKGS